MHRTVPFVALLAFGLVSCKPLPKTGTWASVPGDEHSAAISLREDGTFAAVFSSPVDDRVSVRTSGTYSWIADRVSLSVLERLVCKGEPAAAAPIAKELEQHPEKQTMWLRRSGQGGLELLIKLGQKSFNDIRTYKLQPSDAVVPETATAEEQAVHAAALEAAKPPEPVPQHKEEQPSNSGWPSGPLDSTPTAPSDSSSGQTSPPSG